MTPPMLQIRTDPNFQIEFLWQQTLPWLMSTTSSAQANLSHTRLLLVPTII
jgi:hypothetical protein